MSEEEAKGAEEALESNDSEASDEITDALKFLFRWNTEIVSFYTHRYQQDAALPVSLMACTTPSDVLTIQRDFLRQLVADYGNEAVKLSQIVAGPDGPIAAATGSSFEAELQKAQATAAAIIEEAKAQAEHILASAEDQANQLMGSPEEQTDEPSKSVGEQADEPSEPSEEPIEKQA